MGFSSVKLESGCVRSAIQHSKNKTASTKCNRCTRLLSAKVKDTQAKTGFSSLKFDTEIKKKSAEGSLVCTTKLLSINMYKITHCEKIRADKDYYN